MKVTCVVVSWSFILQVDQEYVLYLAMEGNFDVFVNDPGVS